MEMMKKRKVLSPGKEIKYSLVGAKLAIKKLVKGDLVSKIASKAKDEFSKVGKKARKL